LLLAMSVLLLAASKADAGKYAVAQCGWYVGADASWGDTTGGAKFRPDAYCVPPAGADPFAGAHMKSFGREGQGTVSGTRFAGWRWTPPPGNWISQVRGTWWHALHDGFEHRLGAINWAGGFEPQFAADGVDVTPREFVRGFSVPVAGFESRLLCARAESKWCALDPGSWSGLRALTITVEDPIAPSAGITGGDLVAGGWRRGVQAVLFTSSDAGSGVRFGETRLDGARVGLTEYPCAMASIGGEWRATRMQPCLTTVSQAHPIATTSFSDGPHTLVHCGTDFGANSACAASRTILIDNNPPAHPRAVTVAGGDGWRRTNGFNLSWENPDQGPASPIAGANWRMVGSAGYDTGVRFASGRDRRSLANLSTPSAGTYLLQLWLRDEAGNEAPSSAVTVPLRLDDVRPTLGFSVEGPDTHVKVDVGDAHSGPASGEILYRRVDAADWVELATKLVRGGTAGRAHLVAPMPQLGFGTFIFRADARDAAGNSASTNLRTDGTQMAIRRIPPPQPPSPSKPQLAPKPQVAKVPPRIRDKARLFARLHGGRLHGDSLLVGFGAPVLLSGRLTRADGVGIGDRELRVVSRPFQGALMPVVVETVRTGEEGGFELQLPAGPSRRLTVSFLGDDGLEPTSRRALELQVRAGVSLRAVPRQLETGQLVRLSGRVRSKGVPIPRRGKLVAVQYLEQATGTWRPVLVTRSDHRGRFRARYRFRYVTGRAAIRLRATALPEERWPYAPGSSARVTVRVRGS
jgi:hypothetical protein